MEGMWAAPPQNKALARLETEIASAVPQSFLGFRV